MWIPNLTLARIICVTVYTILRNVDHTVIYDAVPFIIINYILLNAVLYRAVDGLKKNNNNNKIRKSRRIYQNVNYTHCGRLQRILYYIIICFRSTPSSTVRRWITRDFLLSITLYDRRLWNATRYRLDEYIDLLCPRFHLRFDRRYWVGSVGLFFFFFCFRFGFLTPYRPRRPRKSSAIFPYYKSYI